MMGNLFCNNSNCGGDTLWILILLILLGGNGCGNSCSGNCGGSSCAGDLIFILILLSLVGGNGIGCGGNCGCEAVSGCGCAR